MPHRLKSGYGCPVRGLGRGVREREKGDQTCKDTQKVKNIFMLLYKQKNHSFYTRESELTPRYVG